MKAAVTGNLPERAVKLCIIFPKSIDGRDRGIVQLYPSNFLGTVQKSCLKAFYHIEPTPYMAKFLFVQFLFIADKVPAAHSAAEMYIVYVKISSCSICRRIFFP